MTLEDIQLYLEPDNLKKIGSLPLPFRIGVIVLACILVLGAGYALIVSSQQKELEKVQVQESDLKSEFDRKQMKASNLNAYEEQLEEMKKTFGSMLKSLPDKTEVDNLLVEVSRAGSSNNLDITGFKPTGEESKEFYAEYPISMKLRGSYTELTGFISSVAAMQRIVTLHNITIQPGEIEGVNVNTPLDVALTAKTYRYLSDDESSK
ncbi:pilus assembly protein, PilO [gamma proteobacterium HTCC5015]|nr:pilus assembly protein, PilO [gamma proteobacterium HTCC5015]